MTYDYFENFYLSKHIDCDDESSAPSTHTRRQLYSIDSVRGILKLIVFHDSLLADIEVGKKTWKVRMEKDFHRVYFRSSSIKTKRSVPRGHVRRNPFPFSFPLLMCSSNQIKIFMANLLYFTFPVAPLQKSVFHSFFYVVSFPLFSSLSSSLLTITNFSISGKKMELIHIKRKTKRRNHLR